MCLPAHRLKGDNKERAAVGGALRIIVTEAQVHAGEGSIVHRVASSMPASARNSQFSDPGLVMANIYPAWLLSIASRLLAHPVCPW